jgi:hypothetical protein
MISPIYDAPGGQSNGKLHFLKSVQQCAHASAQERTSLSNWRRSLLSAKRTATSWSVKVRCGAFSGQNSTVFVTGGIDRFGHVA